MTGPKGCKRDDIMNAGMTTPMKYRIRLAPTSFSYSLAAMTAIVALLGLSVQLGCGNASSASSKTKVNDGAVAKNEADQSSRSESAAGSADAGKVSFIPASSSPEIEQVASTSSEPAPAAEPPASTQQPAPPAETTVSNSSEAKTEANVRPTAIALVNAEQAPEPAKKSKPQAADASSPVDPNRTTNYTFDDLKFDIEKDAPFERSMLPKKIEGYAGQRVSVRGFILPTSFQTGLTSFVLVRDNMECCFGPGAALYDCIVVEMAEGKSTDYSIRPVTVEGRFAIEEFIGPGRRHLAIYKIVADKVE